MNSLLHKTKIVCTIGPASEDPVVMRKLLDSGMNIARLNYSHGDFDYHATNIKNLRKVAQEAGKQLTILADLPGPKMRIGNLAKESIFLVPGAEVILTSDDILGDETRISVSFTLLPNVVVPGNIIYLNDGIIQLKVLRSQANDVYCKVVVGGELRSKKGMNLQGVNLGICAFTDHDKKCLQSALENGVDAVGQSFVNEAQDVIALRQAACEMGYNPFVIAKIERADALDRIDEILNVADGIMIARGDLGVETRIERIAVVQKQLTSRANLFGKPVIIATQLLESMVRNPRPTRAEATDVANAILDGADCVMLSEESAMGKYPVEAVMMLAAIAVSTEPQRAEASNRKRAGDFYRSGSTHITDIISHNVSITVDYLQPLFVIAHTVTGHTARMISRFKLPVWIYAISCDDAACRGMQFSYGVYPILVKNDPFDWKAFAKSLSNACATDNCLAILVEGPSNENPLANHRIEILNLNM